MASQQYYYDLIKKQSQEQMNKDIADIKAQAEANKTMTTDAYKAQIADTNESYNELHRKNEQQRLLNQRYIERKAAEMGLTDSGFNRTQLTASQLAYSNQQGEYFRQQQKAVDTLAMTMKNKILELETAKNTNINAIEKSYDQYATEQATKLYDADVAAAAKAEAARISAANADKRAYQSKVNDLAAYMLKDSTEVSDIQKGYMLKNAGDLEPEDYLYLLGLATGETIPDPSQVKDARDYAIWKKLKMRFGLE